MTTKNAKSELDVEVLQRQIAAFNAREIAYLERQRTLSKIGQLTISDQDINQILQQVVDVVQSLIDTNGIAILLRDGENELVFAAANGMDAQNLVGKRVSIDDGIVGQVLNTSRLVMIEHHGEQQAG